MKVLYNTTGRVCFPRMFLLYFLSPLLLVILFKLNAQATITQTIDITVTYYATPSWITSSDLGFSIFESTSSWPSDTSTKKTILANGGTALVSGVSEFEVSIDFTDLSKLYMSMSGSIWRSSPYSQSIFVAEPPDGHVLDELAWRYGPPWISLKDLRPGLKLSGDLQIINGFDSQAETSHPWIVGVWELTTPAQVPEPNTILLFGTGLTVLVATGRRMTKL